ncbi:MAG: SusC/RagA family TonB-linked outer membrane protein [Dysgonamonadaceae bacterium]|jgi:TonB-linked SusC/RagA family outer membrane protein|nr:SusC/RagA family TonB-linked outer membrane protein [Dysgonamonadaceae bacterium]
MKMPLKTHNHHLLLSKIKCLICLFLLGTQMLFSQNQTEKVSGWVVDEQGESITGASVAVVGSSRGTITDLEGKFVLDAPENAILRISFLGYVTQNVRVSPELKIRMKEDVQTLNEVVITAMGITREAKSLSYARESVDTESMRDSRGTSLSDMLSGKVAGMQVTPGGPLASTRIIMRGNNSITGNNQPLFVVDGVPLVNPSGESDDLDFGNIANSINPDEIESIEVLKGANASALYGSDAANGVVLITTKKARAKKGLGISYGLNTMFSYLYNFPTYQNIYGSGQNNRFQGGYNYYGATGNGVVYNPDLPYGIHSYNMFPKDPSWGMPMLGFDIVGRNDEVRPYAPSPGTIQDMYQTSLMTTHSLAVDKVLSGLAMRFSYTNIHGDDILENFNKLNRNVFNLRTTANLTRFLDLDMNVRYTNENVDNRGFRNNSNRNPLNVINGLPRDATLEELIPWKKPDGTPYTRNSSAINPYWLLNETSNADENHWITANATLTFKLSKLFSLRLKGATDVNTASNWNFNNYYSPFDIDGYYQTGSNLNKNHNFDALFSCNQRFKNNITLGGNVGVWTQMIRRYGKMSRVNVLAEPDKKTLANNAGTMISSESYNGKDKQAIFGMGSFGYKDWLYIDATARNEWSSALPVNNNSYFYYSAGTAIVLSDLLEVNKKILSFAKLRASYAQVGNDTGFDNLYNGYYYAGTYLGNSMFYGESDRRNPNLKPESTRSTELGADLHFWDNRISLDFTYYDKTTRDQIIRADVSPVSGYASRWINAGEMRNWGTEVVFGITPLKLTDFTWTSTVNWAKNNSEVVSLTGGMERFLLGTGTYVQLYAQVGKPYGVFYGNDYRRDDEGHILVDLSGIPMANEDRYLGETQPEWLGGWKNTFRIHNIDINVMLDFQKGGLVWSNTAFRGGINGTTVQSLEGRYEDFFSEVILGETDEERKGIMNPGNTVKQGADNYANHVLYLDARQKGVHIPNAVYDPSIEYWGGQPSIAWCPPTNYWTHSNNTSAMRYIYDASYIKLREISVGYNLPKKWLAKTLFTGVKLSLTGRNVAVIYQNTPKGVDPQATRTAGNAQGFEMGFALPQAYWGGDLKIEF